MLENDLVTTKATLSALAAAKPAFMRLSLNVMSYVCSDIQSLGMGRLEFAADFRTVIAVRALLIFLYVLSGGLELITVIAGSISEN
jgi:hypothetical protein